MFSANDSPKASAFEPKNGPVPHGRLAMFLPKALQ